MRVIYNNGHWYDRSFHADPAYSIRDFVRVPASSFLSTI